MRSNVGIVFTLAMCLGLGVSGCTRGLTLHSATIPSNASLSVGTLVNDVERPEFDRFALQSYCGHLAEKLPGPGGMYRSLYIPAYEGDAIPALIVPAADAEQRYHSLLDKGGAAQLGLYGQNVTLSGEDKVEVIVNQLAYCQLNVVSKAAITKALPELDALQVNRNNVYWVAGAFDTQMVTTVMHSISGDTKDAIGPVFNFNGNYYSKDTTTKYQDFIGLQVVPINAVVTNAVGSTAPIVAPAAAQPAAGAPVMHPYSLLERTNEMVASHKMSTGPSLLGPISTPTRNKFQAEIEQAAGQKSVKIRP